VKKKCISVPFSVFAPQIREKLVEGKIFTISGYCLMKTSMYALNFKAILCNIYIGVRSARKRIADSEKPGETEPKSPHVTFFKSVLF
jgi:hypothetical protein